jgi:GMP synthase-like glutamine amidotransferase
MIIFVDLEHDHLQQTPILWEQSRARLLKIKYRLEDISGEPCLIIRYDKVNPEQATDVSPSAIVVSGCFTDYMHYDPQMLAGLRALYQHPPRPIIGFCAGMQLMAETHGATLGPIGAFPSAMPPPDLLPTPTPYPPDMAHETGFLSVEITESEHPLLAGLPTTPTVYQIHYWEIKDLPVTFETLAQSEITPIQIIAHRTLPLFGTQFHAEQFNEEHKDGRKLLENFFKLLKD